MVDSKSSGIKRVYFHNLATVASSRWGNDIAKAIISILNDNLHASFCVNQSDSKDDCDLVIAFYSFLGADLTSPEAHFKAFLHDVAIRPEGVSVLPDRFIRNPPNVCPIVFLSVEDISHLFDMADTLGLNRLIGIMDYDIWHHYVQVPFKIDTFVELIKSILGNDIYKTVVALESLQLTLHSSSNVISDFVRGHQKFIHNDFVPKSKVLDGFDRCKVANQSLINSLINSNVRILVVDDHIEKQLRNIDGTCCSLNKYHFIYNALVPIFENMTDSLEIKKIDTIESALKFLATPEGELYDLILLDYVFSNDPNNIITGGEFVNLLLQQLKASNQTKWIFFISAFPGKIIDEISNTELSLFYNNIKLHPGDNPICRPELTSIKLLQFLIVKFTQEFIAEEAVFKSVLKQLHDGCFSCSSSNCPDAQYIANMTDLKEQLRDNYLVRVELAISTYQKILNIGNNIHFPDIEQFIIRHKKHYDALRLLRTSLSVLVNSSYNDWQYVIAVLQNNWSKIDNILIDGQKVIELKECKMIVAWLKEAKNYEYSI